MTQQAPVEQPLKQHSIWQDGRKPDPCAVVIFGATGDLAQRKLLPTLAHLTHDHPLPQGFCIVAFARRPLSDEQWREMALNAVNQYMPEDDKLDSEAQQAFAQRLFYCQSTFEDKDGYARLAQLLEKLDREQGTGGNRIFYLATPPETDPGIIAQLGEAGLDREHASNHNGHKILVTNHH